MRGRLRYNVGSGQRKAMKVKRPVKVYKVTWEPDVKFFYYRDDKRFYTYMLHAAPQWVNHDFPTIRVYAPGTLIHGYRVNEGLVIEAVPQWIQERFIRFVHKSIQAYERKYEPGSGIRIWGRFLRECNITIGQVETALERKEGEL